MITAIKEKSAIHGGRIALEPLDYPDGPKVGVIVLVEEDEMDATDYLLSTEANRERMEQVLDESQHTENFIPLDIAEYEKRLFNA